MAVPGSEWFDDLHRQLDRARTEAAALTIAARDPRTPRYARLVCVLTVGLAASPIDPIPDFVPVLGYLDDLVFIPLGVALAWRLTPDEVKRDARTRADDAEPGPVRWLIAALVVAAWLAVLVWLGFTVGPGP